MEKQRKVFCIGIDLGGTFIKGGIIDLQGNLLVSNQVDTQSSAGPEQVVKNIANLVEMLIKDFKQDKSSIVGVGLGAPGIIDSEKGIAVCSHNLHFDNFELAKKLKEKTGFEVKIANDANLALLGEVLFGGAKASKNALMITLGTGVGGGAVIDGKLLQGNKSAGAEFGHSVICVDGNKCSCGRKGCLEAYASATALIKQTKEAMKNNKSSKMWAIKNIDLVNGKTAFDYEKTDATAKQVVENYIKYLATGLTNFSNVFRPEVILIGGGISNQGENLICRLQKEVDKQIFASKETPKVKIKKAELGTNAGVLGSIGLFYN